MSDAFNNLLVRAMAHIPGRSLDYYRYIGRTVDTMGSYVDTYETKQVISGCSIQPVPVTKKMQQGIDLARDAVTVFFPRGAKFVRTAKSSDVFEFDSGKWAIFGEENWSDYDGWTQIILVRDQEGVLKNV